MIFIFFPYHLTLIVLVWNEKQSHRILFLYMEDKCFHFVGYAEKKHCLMNKQQNWNFYLYEFYFEYDICDCWRPYLYSSLLTISYFPGKSYPMTWLTSEGISEIGTLMPFLSLMSWCFSACILGMNSGWPGIEGFSQFLVAVLMVTFPRMSRRRDTVNLLQLICYLLKYLSKTTAYAQYTELQTHGFFNTDWRTHFDTPWVYPFKLLGY